MMIHDDDDQEAPVNLNRLNEWTLTTYTSILYTYLYLLTYCFFANDLSYISKQNDLFKGNL